MSSCLSVRRGSAVLLFVGRSSLVCLLFNFSPVFMSLLLAWAGRLSNNSVMSSRMRRFLPNHCKRAQITAGIFIGKLNKRTADDTRVTGSFISSPEWRFVELILSGLRLPQRHQNNRDAGWGASVKKLYMFLISRLFFKRTPTEITVQNRLLMIHEVILFF